MFSNYRGFSSHIGQLDISGDEMTGILVPEKDTFITEKQGDSKSEYVKSVESDINKYVIDNYIQGVRKHCLMKEYGRNIMLIKGYIDNECYKSVNKVLNNGLADLETEVETIWKNVQKHIEKDKSIEKRIEPITERSKKSLEELLLLITKQLISLIKDGYDNNRISQIIAKYKYDIIPHIMILYKG